MTERLFQFIWQSQYFNQLNLETTAGEPLQILNAGRYNCNQGPDFLDARIKIGNTSWAGNVEMHIKTSDWIKHQHQDDRNYNNVILHVVWKNDAVINSIPVLELEMRVSKILLQRYEELMKASAFIPCEKMVGLIAPITWNSWKESLVVERLMRKRETIETSLQQNHHHWEETFWWLLARNFGMTVNAEAFELIARSVPISLLAKYKNQLHQLEALLLGQAGLLDEYFKEDYPRAKKREYEFMRKKYDLLPIQQPIHFLRMRPGNFPTVRLAQLAMLIHQSSHLFTAIRDEASIDAVRKRFEITASDYWHHHYCFDEMSGFKKKKIGESMIDNIVVNTLVPFLFSYGEYLREDAYKEKALNWLLATSAEHNSITKSYQELGVSNSTALDSQALIELKKEYCIKRRCLDCAIGKSLLKK